MQKKLRLEWPIVVEGKYDKIKLSSIVESQIIVLDGFGIFKDKEKNEMLRRIAKHKGLIILTDSDGGGLVIRNHLRSIIPQDKLIHLYIPEIEGKEKRKASRSKEGLLGVEGVDSELLIKLLSPYEKVRVTEESRSITRADLYEDGLLGGLGSSEKRKALCRECGLPQNISSNSLLEALELLYSYDEYKEIIGKIL
jgi:ribonuclease M5